jgi:hypothetical protein
VENVAEALTEPGEWYLDRPSGKLYYLPRPGEDMEHTEVLAPKVTQLLKLVGKPEDNQYVEYLHFKDLTFATADWYQPVIPATRWNRPDLSMTGNGQAASQLSGAIQLIGARFCAIENCHLAHIGWYAIDVAEGCTGNRIVGNEMTDLGAGGVKINGAGAAGPLSNRTSYNRITDNHIYAGGRIYPSTCAILAMNSIGNTLSYNHIHDFYYTGISCGWVWGYGESVSRDNMIEGNHIHDLGQNVLNDMGGVYTLGVQSGTVIRGNLIHDINAFVYGAWCIYPDEGSSHLLIENNVCYNTNHHIFFEHFGRENIVRNNIFGFGADGVVSLGVGEKHDAFSLERNILLSDGPAIYRGGYAHSLDAGKFHADLNLIWDYAGTPVLGQDMKAGSRTFNMEQWHKLGQDTHSIVSDPMFKDAAKRDFTLSPDSPAFSLGFHAIDLSNVGPRPMNRRD